MNVYIKRLLKYIWTIYHLGLFLDIQEHMTALPDSGCYVADPDTQATALKDTKSSHTRSRAYPSEKSKWRTKVRVYVFLGYLLCFRNFYFVILYP